MSRRKSMIYRGRYGGKTLSSITRRNRRNLTR